jgi:N-acetyl-anhydromuramyl-L-alanine amidase AmpD
MKNKRGGKIISVYWFAILFIVAAAIVYMAALFYGAPYDARDIESEILTNHIADCLSQGGYLKENVLGGNLENNFLEECNLNFAVEDTYGWGETSGSRESGFGGGGASRSFGEAQEQYYVEVGVYGFNQDYEDGIGEKRLSIVEGNVNLKTAFMLERAEEEGGDKEMVVIHYTEGYTAQGAIETLEANDLSIHYMIEKNGNVISRDNVDTLYPNIDDGEDAFKEESQRADHAGCYDPRANDGKGEWRPECPENCITEGLLEEGCSEQCCIRGFNQKSIGIELVNLGTEEYPEVQIGALVNLVSNIVSRNNIPVDRDHIIGHEEITNFKSDPGPAFPWEDFIERVNAKEYNPSARSFYVLDNAGNQYVIKILAIVGKTEKNVA